MKMNYTLLLIVFIASVIVSRVTADSEAIADTKNRVLSKPNRSNDRVNGTVDSVGKGTVSNLDKTDAREGSESKGKENEPKKLSGSALKDEQKENKGLDSESKKETPIREKCDSSSNSCTDDDKTFVACLRVPGNESPELSLLIQNKGKVPLSVSISVPDLVQLEKKRIELQEKEDTEVKVSISGVESGHFIILTAGHGNCSLDFREQFVGWKKADDANELSYYNIFNPHSPMGFFFMAALVIIVMSVMVCAEYGKRCFARISPKYQKLDTELPVSHGSKLEAGGNEGWDDSWGDNWDDEEAPMTPSLPVTPSLSSKGIASRKLSKDGWKD
ncbi:hypothetical protein BUALT_Bualt10G0064900 [Buddleja alternifolia]|uniref:DUF7356 domain-containing protein n=1 Tax=Buddleja alternifolia TaxID=168488 RepID=A0AAV6X3T3_9LAMI|nr:hypothetical protein BUALT_Bualt10G0064900 [Buddleja alternifolia]